MTNLKNLKMLLILMLSFVGCFVSVAAQGESPQSRKLTKAERAVMKLQREWLDAYEQRDDVAMERIVADDFTITYTSGRMQRKPQIIAFLKAQRSPSNPAPKYTVRDVESRVYGDIVVLVGLLLTGRNRNGQIVREWSRYTDTYRRQKGRWQVIA